MLTDLQFAFRQLRLAPGFTAMAVLTLALGIGACTSVYSVLQGVLVRPLPYADPERIVIVQESKPGLVSESHHSAPNYLELHEQARSYEYLAATAGTNVNLTGEAEPQRLVAVRTTPDYFKVLGLKPAQGRTFLPEEDAFGQHRVVVLSHDFWQNTLGGSAKALTQTLQLNGEAYQIIGIMPRGEYPRTDIWLPMAFRPAELGPEGRDLYFVRVYGRLKAGVSVATAREEAVRIAATLAERYPETNAGWTMKVTPVHEFTVRDVRGIVYALSGAVICVLLVACANVANLQLARTTVRAREMSLRSALGAGRLQLVRQLLTESLVLAVVAGGLGVLIAVWGLDALIAMAPSSLPGLAEIRLDRSALAFNVALAFASGIAFGLPAALVGTREELTTSLKQGARGLSEHGLSGRLRSILVVFEVAVALTLLTSAGLLGRSLLKLARTDPGFDADRVAVMRLNLSRTGYGQPDQQRAFVSQVEARLRALPGIEAVGTSHAIPLLSNNLASFAIDGRAPVAVSDMPGATFYSVTPDYFRAMGIRLTSGRFFTELDHHDGPRVAVINETLARQHFPGENPIGRRIEIRGLAPGWREIVGVVADVRQQGPTELATNQIYTPFAQTPELSINFLLRTTGPIDPVLGALRPLVYSIDSNQPVGFVRPLADALGDTIARQRFAAQLLGVFSLTAVVIAAVGIYGVMAYSVVRRTREIGIRVALGAQPADVVRMIVTQASRLVIAGVIIGLAASYAGARAIEGLLYQTNAHDFITFVFITPFVALIAMIAALIPARNATRVDPMVALRND
ncbi:MAG TPA: ABC transporter permease [Opitutaceae bacterium]